MTRTERQKMLGYVMNAGESIINASLLSGESTRSITDVIENNRDEIIRIVELKQSIAGMTRELNERKNTLFHNNF